MTSRQCDPIDERVEAELERLHEEHPNLGHEGLMDALEQQGIHVAEAELKEYVEAHQMEPEVAKHSWGWVASRWIPDIGLLHRGPPSNRSFRRMFRRRK